MSGTISNNQTWTLANSPYVVTATITITATGFLTVEPGVVVKFQPGAIEVYGKLLAAGQPATPIVFTSNASTAAQGDWYGIRFWNGSSAESQLSYASISYAGRDPDPAYGAGLYLGGPNVSIDHVTVTHSARRGVLVGAGTPTLSYITSTNNSQEGVYASGSGTALILTNATVSSNSSYGVAIAGGASLTIRDSAINNNGNYPIKTEANAPISEITNTTASGNANGNAIYHSGGTISGTETWRNFSLPWITPGSVQVPATATWVVESGTTVKVINYAIEIAGKLTAVGTAASPITFTSTNAWDGAWYGIRFWPGSSAESQLSYASISYAGRDPDPAYGAGLYLGGPNVSIDHVTVTHSARRGVLVGAGTPALSYITSTNNSEEGVYASGSGTALILTNATVSSNSSYGVAIAGGASLTIRDSAINNNGNYPIKTEANAPINEITNTTASGNANGNAIYHSGGTISGTETWRNFSLPWITPGSVQVPATATWVVESGTTVKVINYAIEIAGKLTAVGTAASPITFTSTNAWDGAWYGIRFWPGSSAESQLSYASISYAGRDPDPAYGAGLYLGGPNVSIDHVTVTHSARRGVLVGAGTPALSYITSTNNSQEGVYASGSGTALILTNATVSSNSSYGVAIAGGASLTIRDSAINNNGNYPIKTEANAPINEITNTTASGNANGNAIYHSGGTISGTETWRNFSLPWITPGSVQVPATATWVVESGTTVKVINYAIEVSGKLTAVGTASSPITFTSTNTTNGAWYGIRFWPGSSAESQLSYASISYAGRDADATYGAGIYFGGPTIPVDHVTVSNSARRGIIVAAGTPAFNYVTMTNNSQEGMYVTGSSQPTLRNCSFGSNAGGLVNVSTNAIDAKLNDWGAVSGPGGVGGGGGQSITKRAFRAVAGEHACRAPNDHLGRDNESHIQSFDQR